MKLYSIIIFLFLLMADTKSQKYTKMPIPAHVIDQGVRDFQFFRPILLEYNFSLNKKDDKGEYWEVTSGDYEIINDVIFNGPPIIYVQLSAWKYEGKEYSRQIFFQIRKELLTQYSEIFLENIKEYYPLKKAEPIKTNFGTSQEKDNYKLIYYRQNSKVEVEYNENGSWMTFDFRLETIPLNKLINKSK